MWLINLSDFICTGYQILSRTICLKSELSMHLFTYSCLHICESLFILFQHAIVIFPQNNVCYRFRSSSCPVSWNASLITGFSGSNVETPSASMWVTRNPFTGGGATGRSGAAVVSTAGWASDGGAAPARSHSMCIIILHVVNLSE